ncbi:MAG: hypothetical protein NZ932_04000 [Candidatus Bathyarchaeota archaeon]|nr:hypothetical protein [Candidatus Bathyarchaeota archaeon]MDW8022368.1 hypothetical protein [Nitrososphaerota archaeon]
MDVIVLSIAGFFIVAAILFFIVRNLEAVIFWSALCAPAVGTSLVNALIHAFSGNYELAAQSLKFLPFFIAALDKAFFMQTDTTYHVVGAVFILIWSYILAHYAVKKFGMWSIPIIPPIIWGVGLTLQNLREKLMSTFPNFAFLFDFYGIPALILTTSLLFGICYLIWRRGYQIARLPMWLPQRKNK